MSFKTAALLVGATFLLGSASAALAKPAEHQFSGQVTQLDSKAKTLVVKSQLGELEMTFSMPAGVEILQAGKAKKLSELKVGQRVNVTYTTEDLKNQAHRINLLTAKVANAKPAHPAAAKPAPKANN